MTAILLKGANYAPSLLEPLKPKVEEFKTRSGVTPKLVVFLLGDSSASMDYVSRKGVAAKAVGMDYELVHLSKYTTQKELLDCIGHYRDDPKVHGILVQLPLPRSKDKNGKIIDAKIPDIDESVALAAVGVDKDVDGLHPDNLAKLGTPQQSFIPCTPRGAMIMLEKTMSDFDKKKVVIIGRGPTAGAPMATLLKSHGVRDLRVVSSQTPREESDAWIKEADLVIAAVGKPDIFRLTGNQIKPGAVVIDIGIGDKTLPDGTTKKMSDVDTQSCLKIASAITPYPGGVGPMTVACLLDNTYQAAVAIEKAKQQGGGHSQRKPVTTGPARSI
jgi:methylenetetrahydrofolate dehydrogenase (NADP+)/methenyltetrahydrofolate cyclohydrolase